jgi:hypothetical protein
MEGEASIYDALMAELQSVDPCRRYGQSGQPIPATETYRRILSTLRRDGIRVERWILINQIQQTVTYAFTYDGVVGAHYDVRKNTHDLSWERLRPKLEDYQYVPADDCPIARPISSRKPAGLQPCRYNWPAHIWTRR